MAQTAHTITSSEMKGRDGAAKVREDVMGGVEGGGRGGN